MRIVAAIARILLGLGFLIFGANSFLNFMKGQLPPGLAGQFLGALIASHYVYVTGFFMVAGGLLLLINRFVPLALVFLGPILVNILTFHLLMAPATIAPGLVFTILWFIVFYSVRGAFAPLFQPRAQ